MASRPRRALVEGDFVFLRGLSTNSEYNFRAGAVVSAGNEGRLVVELLKPPAGKAGKRRLSVKRANLFDAMDDTDRRDCLLLQTWEKQMELRAGGTSA